MMYASGKTKPALETNLPSNAAQSWAHEFLDGFSVELLPRHLPLLHEKIAPRLRAKRRVYIALVDPAEIPAQVDMATALRRLGLEPVPHLPARFMGSPADLELHLRRLTDEAGIVEVLALGGGVPQPYGEFHSVMEMLQTGFFQKHGIRRLGLAGHVEGNRDITKGHDEELLLRFLQDKVTFATEAGMDVYLVTQFAFDMHVVAGWVENIRAAGISRPIRIGFAGPAKLKTLLHYSLMCGVGPSIRILRKQAKAVHRLLKVSTPDEIINDLANLVERGAFANAIVAPHFFPLGGIEANLNWLQGRLIGHGPEGELIPL